MKQNILTQTMAHEATTGPKEEIRQLMISETKKLYPTQPIQIITLPGKEHLCYDRFKEAFPRSRITCLERDKTIWEHLYNEGLHPIQKTVSEYLSEVSSNDGPFQLIFLDYYTHLIPSVLKDLQAIAKGNDRTDMILPTKGKKAIIGITLMKTHRGGNETANSIVAGVQTRQDEVITAEKNNILARIKMEFHKDYNCVDIPHDNEIYKARDKSVQMYFFCLSLERK